MPIKPSSLTINDGSSNNTRFIWVNAANDYSFAEKVNIAVTEAGIGADVNLDDIALISIVDCRLDIIKIPSSTVIILASQGTAQSRKTNAKTNCFISKPSSLKNPRKLK
ncbi:MAG: hypothetical protein ACYSR5_07970 [Planctomycetota bacterium]